MADKIVIMVCEYYRAEAELILNSGEFPDVELRCFPARCGHPPLSDDDFSACLDSESDKHVHILAGCCTNRINGTLSEKSGCSIHHMDQCFYLLINRDYVDHLLRSGSYLLTSGWLARWEENLAAMGFDEKTAKQFFADTTKELVLLDSGVFPDSGKQLQCFAEYVDRPFQVLPVGIDFFRKTVFEIVADSRRKNASARSRELQKKLSEYALAIDILGTFSEALSETEVIDKITSMFSMLFGSEEARFLAFDKGDDLKVSVKKHLGDTHDCSKIIREGYELIGEHGFYLLFQSQKEYIGMIKVDQLTFPSYLNQYLNLALLLRNVCGLAINNIRVTQELKEENEDNMRLISSLKKAASEIRSLQKIVPVCSWCKQVRDDKGYWQAVESYLLKYSGTKVSHGICPECAKKIFLNPGKTDG